MILKVLFIRFFLRPVYPQAFSICKIIFLVSSILTGPNSEDSINLEADKLYKGNKYEYNKKAKEWDINSQKLHKSKAIWIL